MWFQFRVTNASQMSFSTCGRATDFDTVIAIVDATGTELLAINDDPTTDCLSSPQKGAKQVDTAFGCRLDESVVLASMSCVNVGSGEYQVVVAGKDGAEGNFVLTITPSYLGRCRLACVCVCVRERGVLTASCVCVCA